MLTGTEHLPEERRPEVVELTRGGGRNLLGAAFNQILKLGITFLLARLLGRQQAGIYYQVYAFLAFLGLVSAGGFLVSLTRFVAVHRAEGDDGAVRGTVRVGVAVSTGAAAILGAALYLSSSWLASAPFHDMRLATPLRIVALALVPTVLTDAVLAATRGFRTMRPYASINLVFEPSCRIVLTVALLAAGWGLEGALIALLVTNTIAAVLACMALRSLMSVTRGARRHALREILGFSVKSLVSTLADNALLWADVVLLGILAGAADVGVYVIATRLTLLATLGVGPISTALAPRITDLYQRGLRDSLQATYALVTAWMVRMALPGFVMLLLFPKQLLALFGTSFTTGVSVTIILACAQLLRMVMGPSGDMLLMSGHATIVMVTDVAGLVVNVALNLWLIPRYGITGAAIAWAVEILLISTASFVQVLWIMRMAPFGAGLAKGAAAASAAFVAALLARSLSSGAASLASGGLVVAVVYVGGLWLLGLGAEDRLVLATVWGRVRARSA